MEEPIHEVDDLFKINPFEGIPVEMLTAERVIQILVYWTPRDRGMGPEFTQESCENLRRQHGDQYMVDSRRWLWHSLLHVVSLS